MVAWLEVCLKHVADKEDVLRVLICKDVSQAAITQSHVIFVALCKCDYILIVPRHSHKGRMDS